MNSPRIPRALLLCALLLPSLALPRAAAQVRQDEAPVSLSFVDTDIRDAFRLVARQCDINMVISNRVEGTVTLELDGATLDEALDALASVGGLQCSVRGRIVTVQTLEELREQRAASEPPQVEPQARPEPDTLVVNLRYVDAERVQPIVQSLLSEVGSVTFLRTSDQVEMERDLTSGLLGPGARPQAALGQQSAGGLQIGTRLSSSSVGDPAKSHTLVVVDLPARLAHIERVIGDIDRRPPQVVIEARFVEISLDDNQRLGIDWSVVASMNGASTPQTAPFGTSSLGSINPNVSGGTNGVFPPAPNSVTTPGEPGLFTFGTLDFTTFSALLEMIQQNRDVEMVSNPSVVVRDRHTATILVGERYPILSANISEFGTVTEQLDHYEPIGVQLAVTPSVLGDEVELLVRPSTSDLGADVEGSTGLAVARINSRQIDTLVSVKNGQTVVIGGLITTREEEVLKRVPLVGSLPLLGRLFQHRETVKQRVDLVVFLTVSIADEHGLTDEQRSLFEETTTERTFAADLGARTELELVPSAPRY